VVRLLKCGITLHDFHVLVVEDAEACGEGEADTEDGGAAAKAQEYNTPSMRAVSEADKRLSTLDEDLAMDTGFSTADARKLRHAVVAFYKCWKCLGFLNGQGFNVVLSAS